MLQFLAATYFAPVRVVVPSHFSVSDARFFFRLRIKNIALGSDRLRLRKAACKIFFRQMLIHNISFFYLTVGRVNIFKSFRFSLAKKRSRSRLKISAPASDKFFNRLQLKNLGSGSATLMPTGEQLRLFLFLYESCFDIVYLK